MPDINPETLVYFENDFVPLSQAKVPILTHALHYGTGVFEGIRAYWCSEQQEMFLIRCDEHFARWKSNGRILGIDPPLPASELSAITAELIRLNHFQTDVYVRPICYMSTPKIGVRPDGKSQFAIVTVPFGAYLPSENGIHAGVASWRRVEDTAIPCRAKICGAYVNSVLATTEAHLNGYDEAILLSENGHVAEGATCNLFLVRNGRLITPAPSDNILEGIVRASVLELARKELHLEVVERSVDRTELYVADEIFLTGTAVEIAPVTRIDHRVAGSGHVGPLTEKLRELYREAVHGRIVDYASWLTPVYQPVLAALHS
jgi:branched-chain amino acid aminotransferase